MPGDESRRGVPGADADAEQLDGTTVGPDEIHEELDRHRAGPVSPHFSEVARAGEAPGTNALLADERPARQRAGSSAPRHTTACA